MTVTKHQKDLFIGFFLSFVLVLLLFVSFSQRYFEIKNKYPLSPTYIISLESILSIIIPVNPNFTPFSYRIQFQEKANKMIIEQQEIK